MPLPNRRHEHLIGAGLLIGAVCLTAALSYREARQLRTNTALVAHTQEVLVSLEQMIATLTEAESSQRGYVITGDETYHDSYSQARIALQATLETAARLTQDNPAQQERLARLRTLMSDRLDVLARNVELRRSRDFDTARESIATGEGRTVMLEIRNLAAQMIQQERDLLESRNRQNDEAFRSLSVSILCGMLLGLAAIWAFLWLLRRHLQAVEKTMAVIQSQRETQQAQAQALQESSQRKDEFLAMLAHELCNPLAPLSNALQLWPLVENDRAQMEQLRQMMERQVLQMKRLVDDLLDVSRITRGKIELRRQPVELQTTIRGAIEAVQPVLAASNQQLTLDLPVDPIMVDADVARLTQVFGNILQNAAKYTGHGGKIRIAAQAQDGRAVVTISDNGPGIPPHMLTRIFDLFQQVDETLERSHGGLGIGLTLVKQLVELHGGKVEARSPGPGQGSEFVVDLPTLVAERPVDKSSAVDKPNTVDGRRTTVVPKLRILVVDDVQASAKTLTLMLQAIGQDVSMINDGRQAVEWIRTHRPDVVFLDIGMPGMNGYDVARQIRSDAEFQDLFLVALTGYGQEEDRRLAIEAGFNHHLVKPTSIEALEQLLMTRPEQRLQSTGT